MRDEYDFSGAERGKFYRAEAQLKLPVYLDAPIQRFFEERAQAKGIAVGQLINDVLRREIELVEALK
jgi:hypothetical protein